MGADEFLARRPERGSPVRSLSPGRDGQLLGTAGPEPAAGVRSVRVLGEPGRRDGGDVGLGGGDPLDEEGERAQRSAGAAGVAEDLRPGEPWVDTTDLHPGAGDALGEFDGEQVVGELGSPGHGKTGPLMAVLQVLEIQRVAVACRRWPPGRVVRTAPR